MTMTHFDQLILEGKFLFDMTAQPTRDYIPKVEERVARENERRVREGLPLFELDWDSRYQEEDTMFFDANLLCECGDKVEMADEEAVNLGQCPDCLMITRIEEMQNAPLETPAILASMRMQNLNQEGR